MFFFLMQQLKSLTFVCWGILGVQPLKITSNESTKRAAMVKAGVKRREEHIVNLF